MEFLRLTISYIFGTLMVVGMMAFVFKRHAQEWEALAHGYGRDWKRPLAIKRLRSMVLYTEGEPARTYAGIMTIGVYADGIGLKPINWLSPFHKPVFIPFSDIKGWQQKWYWDGKSVELIFRRTPHLQIIMPRKQIEWISAQEQGVISVSEEVSPHKNWPAYTQSMAVLSLFMTVMLLGGLAYKYLIV